MRWLQISVVMEVYLLECALYPAEVDAFVIEDCDVVVMEDDLK